MGACAVVGLCEKEVGVKIALHFIFEVNSLLDSLEWGVTAGYWKI